jgi:hypothetical protein
MSDHDTLVGEIARLVGIADSYKDNFGREIRIEHDSRRAILLAFGLATESEAQASESLEHVRRQKLGLVAP